MSSDTDMAALQAQLKDVRAKRMAAEKKAATLPAVTFALTVAERDEAAVTSPELVAARNRVQRLHDRVLDRWNSALHQTWFARAVMTGESVTDPELDAELDAVDQQVADERAAVTEQLATLGVHLPGLGD